MNIEIEDIITLSDNKKYGVISKTNYQNNTYYYLVDINNKENIKFCVEQDEFLIEVEDEELIKKIIPKLFIKIKDRL